MMQRSYLNCDILDIAIMDTQEPDFRNLFEIELPTNVSLCHQNDNGGNQKIFAINSNFLIIFLSRSIQVMSHNHTFTHLQFALQFGIQKARRGFLKFKNLFYLVDSLFVVRVPKNQRTNFIMYNPHSGMYFLYFTM